MASRDSNIELMRLMAMFFIVFLHFMTNAEFLSEGVDNLTFFSVNTIRGFLLVAVNSFILISGYYGIHFKLRGLFRIYLIVMFYGVLAYFLHMALEGAEFGKSFVYCSVFCISSSKLWFVTCYMALYLLSPILNKARDAMDMHEYIFALVALSVLNVYFGYLWGNKFFNVDGFSIAQMIYMYFIGGFIKRFVPLSTIMDKRYWWIATYVFMTLIWAILSYVNHISGVWHWHTNNYNNPCILISSIAFFLFFISFSFFNASINYFASGVFAVYVVQDGQFFRDWFKILCQKTVSLHFLAESLTGQILSMAVLAFATVFFIVNFDRFRALLIKPILQIIPDKWD